MCNKRLKNVFQPNFSVTEKKFTNFLVPPVTHFFSTESSPRPTDSKESLISLK